jgi:hypothetical protein
MTALLGLAAKAYAWRMGMNVLKLSAVVVFVLLWSACSGAGTVTLIAMQPGGQARLRNPGFSGQDLLPGGGGITTSGVPMPGGPGFIGPVQGSNILPPPPFEQFQVMLTAVNNAPCAFPGVAMIAAIGFYESGYGSNPGPSSAGAWGWAQFMPATFSTYRIDSRTQGNDFRVMIPAAIRKLCDDGIARCVDCALLAYNNSRAYVEHIKALAASWPGVTTINWQDHAAFNQYDPRNWASPQNFNTWAGAACSAASLDWLLTAYGSPPGSIDAALALIGPNTGISSHVGLLDHTGTGLKAALGKAGYQGWQANLNDAQLAERLRQGPAMLDGQRWFGVGHWFVATGADQGGISIRESSGNNVQYLTWARLHGEVGWSGWAVGISPAPVPGNQA